MKLDMSKTKSGPSSRSLLKLKHAREKLNDLVSGDDYLCLFSTVKLLECYDDGSASSNGLWRNGN